MHEFGTFEAKNRFSHLLDLVEHGEEVSITRRGKEVARLIPAGRRTDRNAAHAALAWIFGDETAAIRAVFERVADQGAHVPSLWRLEVANSLTVAVRRNRVDAAFRRAALADFSLLDITIDPHTDGCIWSETLRLADQFRLTLYDASYLELAQRSGLPLATLNRALSAAAQAAGLETLGAA